MLNKNKQYFYRHNQIFPTLARYVEIGGDVILLLFTLALIAAILWSDGVKAATLGGRSYEVDINNIQSGSLLYQLPGQAGTFAAPAVHSNVQVTVTGDIATVELEQEFYNPTSQYIEGMYAFPLSENAAIYSMRLQVDERVIEGKVKEKAAAIISYNTAKKQGKRAALVQQLRPNLYTANVANLAAGETVNVTIKYQQILHYQEFAEQSYYELRVPTAMTPRYTPTTASNLHNALTVSSLAGDYTTFPSAEAGGTEVENHGELNTLNISTKINAGQILREIKSIGYPVVVSGPNGNEYNVIFPQMQTAERDYVLRWYPEQSNQIRVNLLKETLDNEDYYLLRLVPPLQDGSGGHALPREVTYVIDVSGSMHGASLQQAKKALALAVSRLRSQDKFNIVKFSDDASALFQFAKDADEENLSQALNYIRRLETEGGTEIESALKLAFSMPSSTGYTGQIVFLTDGSVSNEQQLFSLIQDNLGQRRLFTIGIGSAPNNHFMTKAAQFGRGVYTYISDVIEVEEKMSALFRQLENPALTDIEVSSDANLQYWPRGITDLYLGQPLTLVIKSDDRQPGTITIKGMNGDLLWQASVDITNASTGKGIARRWARNKIAYLMEGRVSGVAEEQIRAAVLPLAIKHQLVSDYTSFVAIDVTPVRNHSDNLIELSYASAQPSTSVTLASTATSAPLQLIFGLTLLTFASAIRLLAKRCVRRDLGT